MPIKVKWDISSQKSDSLFCTLTQTRPLWPYDNTVTLIGQLHASKCTDWLLVLKNVLHSAETKPTGGSQEAIFTKLSVF